MQEENGLKDGGVIQNTPKLSQAQPHPKRHRASFHKHGVQKTMGARSPSAPPTPSQHLLPTCHGEAGLLAPLLGQTLSKFPAKGQGLKGPNSLAASTTTTHAIIPSPNTISLSASAQAFHTSFPSPLNLLPWAWPAPHPTPNPIMGSDIYLPAVSLSVLSEKLHSLRYQC